MKIQLDFDINEVYFKICKSPSVETENCLSHPKFYINRVQP